MSITSNIVFERLDLEESSGSRILERYLDKLRAVRDHRRSQRQICMGQPISPAPTAGWQRTG